MDTPRLNHQQLIGEACDHSTRKKTKHPSWVADRVHSRHLGGHHQAVHVWLKACLPGLGPIAGSGAPASAPSKAAADREDDPAT